MTGAICAFERAFCSSRRYRLSSQAAPCPLHMCSQSPVSMQVQCPHNSKAYSHFRQRWPKKTRRHCCTEQTEVLTLLPGCAMIARQPSLSLAGCRYHRNKACRTSISASTCTPRLSDACVQASGTLSSNEAPPLYTADCPTHLHHETAAAMQSNPGCCSYCRCHEHSLHCITGRQRSGCADAHLVGRPGMVIMSPTRGMTKPAPALICNWTPQSAAIRVGFASVTELVCQPADSCQQALSRLHEPWRHQGSCINSQTSAWEAMS